MSDTTVHYFKFIVNRFFCMYWPGIYYSLFKTDTVTWGPNFVRGVQIFCTKKFRVEQIFRKISSGGDRFGGGPNLPWQTIFPLKISVRGTKIFRTKIPVTGHAWYCERPNTAYDVLFPLLIGCKNSSFYLVKVLFLAPAWLPICVHSQSLLNVLF